MLISFLLQLSALWLLSMAMNKHFRHTFSKPLTPKLEKMFRYLGWVILCISLFVICLLDPIPLMMVYWVSYLAFNIMIIAFISSLKENQFKQT